MRTKKKYDIPPLFKIKKWPFNMASISIVILFFTSTSWPQQCVNIFTPGYTQSDYIFSGNRVYTFYNIAVKNENSALENTPLRRTLVQKNDLSYLPEVLKKLTVRYIRGESVIEKFKKIFSERGFAGWDLYTSFNLSKSLKLISELKLFSNSDKYRTFTEKIEKTFMASDNLSTRIIDGSGEIAVFKELHKSYEDHANLFKNTLIEAGLTESSAKYVTNMLNLANQKMQSIVGDKKLDAIRLNWYEESANFEVNYPGLHKDSEGGVKEVITGIVPLLRAGVEVFTIKNNEIEISVGQTGHLQALNSDIVHQTPHSRGPRIALILFYINR